MKRLLAGGLLALAALVVLVLGTGASGGGGRRLPRARDLRQRELRRVRART